MILYSEIDITKYIMPEFLSSTESWSLEFTLKQLTIIKRCIDRAAFVTRSNEKITSESGIQNDLIEYINKIQEEFCSIYESILVPYRGTGADTEDIIRNLKMSKQKIAEYYNSFFDVNSFNPRLTAINTVLLLNKDGYESAKEFDSLRITLADTLKQSQDFLSSKSYEIAVEKYVTIFDNQSKTNKTNSTIWLITSLTLSALLITLLLISIDKGWLNPINTIQDNKISNITYNIPNILTKLFIVSLLLYIISFSFRQYSINRHLQTLNTHRRNALNSYKLFSDSITNDTISRNALMLQVAKSIYENDATGYLNIKQTDTNFNIIELAKTIKS